MPETINQMKPNELRIGNCVKWTGETPVELKMTLMDFQYISGDYNLHYQPIPLTPEWLERMGFIKHEDNPFNVGLNMGYWVHNGVCLFFNQSDDRVLTGYGEMRNGIYHVTTFNWNTKYVHQLQNLCFALTGEELEIKDYASERP